MNRGNPQKVKNKMDLKAIAAALQEGFATGKLVEVNTESIESSVLEAVRHLDNESLVNLHNKLFPNKKVQHLFGEVYVTETGEVEEANQLLNAEYDDPLIRVTANA